jgi:RNA recognition motif-containing protein
MNIYVGNLTSSVSEEQLKALFSKFGVVASVKIIKDKYTGNSRGFAFVEMPSTEEARHAIAQCNGQDLDGRPLKVNESKPREGGFSPRRDFNRGGGRGGDYNSGPRGPRRGGNY